MKISIREKLNSFIKGWKEGRALREAQEREATYVTLCDKGHTFNAMHQSGVCPHPPANLQIMDCTRKERYASWEDREVH